MHKKHDNDTMFNEADDTAKKGYQQGKNLYDNKDNIKDGLSQGKEILGDVHSGDKSVKDGLKEGFDIARGKGSSGMENAAKIAAEEAMEMAGEVATEAASAGADAATGGLSKVAREVAKKLKEAISSDSAESDGKVLGNLFIIIGIIFGGILLPMIFIMAPLIMLFALFSNLISGDASKENASVAEESLTFKTAEKEIHGFSKDQILNTEAEAFFVVTYDSKIKKELFEEQADEDEDTEDPIDVSDKSDAMRASDNFGIEINAYKKAETSEDEIAVSLKSDSYIHAYMDGGNPVYSGNYLKAVIKIAGDEEKAIEEGYEISDKNYHKMAPEEGVHEQTEVIVYIHEDHVAPSPMADASMEYTVETEYQLMGAATRALIQNKYNEQRAYIMDKISSEGNKEKNNKFNLQMAEADGNLGEPLVIMKNNKKGEPELHEDSKIDPYGSEFDFERSMANLIDYGMDGAITNDDVAEILSSYAVMKKESIPEKGYFDEFDLKIKEDLENQFSTTMGDVKTEEYLTEFATGEIELDENGNKKKLTRRHEYHLLEEEEVKVAGEDDYIGGMLIDIKATFSHLKDSNPIEYAEKIDHMKKAGTHYDLIDDVAVFENKKRYNYEEYKAASKVKRTDVVQKIARGDYLYVGSQEKLDDIIVGYGLSDIGVIVNGRLTRTHDYVSRSYLLVKDGKIEKLSKPKMKDFEYKKTYVENATIAPFSLSSLVGKFFDDKSYTDYASDKYGILESLYDEEQTNFEKIMSSPYYKSKLVYEYNNKKKHRKKGRKITILSNNQTFKDYDTGSYTESLIKDFESARNKKVSQDDRDRLFEEFLALDRGSDYDAVMGERTYDEGVIPFTPVENDNDEISRETVYNNEQLSKMSVNDLERLHKAGYDFSYEVGPVCEPWGNTPESSCGVKAKKIKKKIFFPVGLKQIYVDNDVPETKITYDEENEDKLDTTPVAIGLREAIINYKENMLEYLDTGLSGIGHGSMDMVRIARGELNQVGGLKYRNWYYGYNQEAHWCAIFVSWVANEAGFLGDIVPKDAGVIGIRNWYQNEANPGSYHINDGSYVPKPGDLAFFSWGTANGGSVGGFDHIEIVSEVLAPGDVRTIGGNTTFGNVTTTPPGIVAEKDYNRNKFIVGYASPVYPEVDNRLSGFEEVVKNGKNYNYDASNNEMGILNWTGHYFTTLINGIKSKDSAVYSEIIDQYSAEDISKLDSELASGGKLTGNSITIVNKILNSTPGKAHQNEIVSKLVDKYHTSFSKYNLEPKPLAYLINVAIDYERRNENATSIQAFKKTLENGGNLKNVHNSIKSLNPYKTFSSNITGVYNHVNKLSETVFAIDFIGLGEATPSKYLRGANQEAILCPFTDEANTKKTYMSYKAITARSSKQWKLQNTTVEGKTASTDPSTGVRVIGNRYMVAMAPTYGTVGTTLDITIGGNIIPVVIGDIKAPGPDGRPIVCQHYDGSFIEFIVDTPKINSQAKTMGSMEYEPKFSGRITKIVQRGQLLIP